MKLLLTSGGVKNESISHALVDLLGKPISESHALIVPTGIYPFPRGGENARALIAGHSKSPLSELGWASLGVLELTALPTIRRENWVPVLEKTDALLVWGGNVMYLRYWLMMSGVAELVPQLPNLVYVGVSAGSIVTTRHNCDEEFNRQFAPDGSDMLVGGEKGLGWVDCALTVHLDHPDPIFEDHTTEKIEAWARGIPDPTYALDDESALVVTNGEIRVVSEGHWHRFEPAS